MVSVSSSVSSSPFPTQSSLHPSQSLAHPSRHRLRSLPHPPVSVSSSPFSVSSSPLPDIDPTHKADPPPAHWLPRLAHRRRLGPGTNGRRSRSQLGRQHQFQPKHGRGRRLFIDACITDGSGRRRCKRASHSCSCSFKETAHRPHGGLMRGHPHGGFMRGSVRDHHRPRGGS